MSYNKLKSLVANVEAIETAMKIQVQGRQATAEEKEILSRYSGFGGIKEVLNIGTDKPIGGDMQEPIQRLQELINAYPHFTEPMRHNVIEGIKASVLTAFYTPKFLVDAVVRQIHATFSENGLKMRSFLEPSAGIGGFLPIAMSGTYDYAIEKDLISGMILSLLHENTLTRTAAFETIGEQGFEHTTFDVIASNIPFGNFRVFDAELWKKGGMYEQATKTIHNYFFVKAMELLNEGGLLAFITSRGIADTPGNKFVREYLVNHADLISAIRLPDMLFMQTSGIEVGSDLLIFQKHTHKTVLSQREQLFLQVGREKADAIGTMTEYANKLFTMPKTTLATGSRIVQNQYGKYVRKYQWQGNENAMSQYLAALLKLDFGRYFRKSLFTGNGQGSEHMQMSLFGNVAMKQVEKGKRAYTDGVEAWMKDGAMVLFEGQVGTIQYRKSSLYQEVAIDFVPVDEGKVNTDRAKDYFPIRKAKIKIIPFTDFCRFIFITYYIIVKQKEKKARNRRTNEQIDKEVISELEKLVAEYGFGNVNLSALMKAANIEANVFYRRYGSMENLYDRLAKQYDFWINDTIDVSSLNILGPKKFFAETFKTLYRNLSDNTVMQKLLLYEMSVINETTKRTAETRDIMNLNLIAFYDNLFKPAKINIKAIMANLIGGIYYLILHRRCAKTCTIDFSTQEGEKVFFEWIDFLTDAIFDKLEAYERNRKAAQEMLSDGISEFKICKYMGINKNDLKMLLSNSHRNSRELSKES